MVDRMECFQPADFQRFSRNVCISVVLFCLVNVTHSWRPYTLKLHSPTYVILSPDFMDYNCTIDETSSVSLYLNIKRDLTTAFLHATYLLADRDGNYSLVYANKTLNFCEFLNNRKIDFVMRVLFAVGERFGQLPTRCPIKKKLYHITNMRISTENLPPVVPEAKGILIFNLMGKVNGGFKTYVSTNVSFALEKIFKSTEGQRSPKKL